MPTPVITRCLEHVEPASLKPAPWNPRTIGAEELRRLAGILDQHGFVDPVIARREDRMIIGGHQRVKANTIRRQPDELVPVIFIDGISDDEAKALCIALNNPKAQGRWDEDLLGRLLQEIASSGQDLLAATAFSQDDLLALTAVLADDADDAAPPVPAIARSRAGAVYILGDHRLMVGDSTSGDDVKTLMAGELADLLLTDPPYNVAYQGKTSDALTIKNDSMDSAAFERFLIAALTTAASVMRPGAAFYIWHAASETPAFYAGCRSAGLPVHQVLIWAKNAFVLGRQDYQWMHEPCLYGWKEGKAHTWAGDRKQASLIKMKAQWQLVPTADGVTLTIDGDTYIISGTDLRVRRVDTTLIEHEKPRRNGDHPTMKPVPLFEYQMRNSTRRGNIVLDLFAGSGTTVVAAEQIGRKARVMELDPCYADVVRRRWAELVHGAGCDWERLTPEAA